MANGLNYCLLRVFTASGTRLAYAAPTTYLQTDHYQHGIDSRRHLSIARPGPDQIGIEKRRNRFARYGEWSDLARSKQTLKKPTANAVLRGNYLFRDLPAATVDKIADKAIRRNYGKDSIVFLQGQQGDSLYGVVRGRVRISIGDINGDEIYLSLMEAGDCFGEIALLDGDERPASAITMEDTELLVIHREHFLALLESEPKISTHLLKLFCERVRWISTLIEETTFLNLPGRLAKRLLILADHHGTQSDQGFTLTISQGQLANFLNISRQIVNQHLQAWQRAGWVMLSRGRITIVDETALVRVVVHGEDC